jgi:hypothetical protein
MQGRDNVACMLSAHRLTRIQLAATEIIPPASANGLMRILFANNKCEDYHKKLMG